MHGQEGALNPRELALDSLLGRIEHNRGALAEHELLDFDESEQLAVAHLAGVYLVNLALIHEHNAKNVTGCHGRAGGACYFDADSICPGTACGTLVPAGNAAKYAYGRNLLESGNHGPSAAH